MINFNQIQLKHCLVSLLTINGTNNRICYNDLTSKLYTAQKIFGDQQQVLLIFSGVKPLKQAKNFN